MNKVWITILTVTAVLLSISTAIGFWQFLDTSNRLADTESILTDTEAELSDTKIELDNTKTELTEIHNIFPLKRFPDLETLASWRNTQPVISREGKTTSFIYEQSLKLQVAAAESGYFVSTCVYPGDGIETGDSIYNTTVLENGEIYLFGIHTRKLTLWASIEDGSYFWSID